MAVIGDGGGKSGVGGWMYPVGLTGISLHVLVRLARLERLLSNSSEGGFDIVFVVGGSFGDSEMKATQFTHTACKWEIAGSTLCRMTTVSKGPQAGHLTLVASLHACNA
jgi:hypothetical protein